MEIVVYAVRDRFTQKVENLPDTIVSVRQRLATRISNWKRWRRRTRRNIGWCASTRSRICAIEESNVAQTHTNTFVFERLKWTKQRRDVTT